MLKLLYLFFSFLSFNHTVVLYTGLGFNWPHGDKYPVTPTLPLHLTHSHIIVPQKWSGSPAVAVKVGLAVLLVLQSTWRGFGCVDPVYKGA